MKCYSIELDRKVLLLHRGSLKWYVIENRDIRRNREHFEYMAFPLHFQSLFVIVHILLCHVTFHLTVFLGDFEITA